MTGLDVSISAETVKARTRPFVARAAPTHDLKDDEDFFALGFVNSLFAMQLVLFVENEFHITIEDDDLNLDHFRTIDPIAGLVIRKSTGETA